MEIDKSLITYRKYDNINVPILKINKGTLLFRLVSDNPTDNTTIEEMMKSSFIGIKNSEDTRCLDVNHNVFFYPYPYIMDTNPFLKNSTNNNMVFFETTCDINVALLLHPSKFYRINKNEENEFLTTCDRYELCGKIPGKYYDPCFKFEFLKQNPDIMGIYGISIKDSNRFMKMFNKPIFKPFRKFIKFHKDIRTKGVPELILYPMKNRSVETIFKIPDSKIDNDEYLYDYIKENENMFNYKLVNVFAHKPLKIDELYKYMNEQKDYKISNKSGFYEKI